MIRSFKNLNWLDYFIQLLIVILGITIAFSIDKCAEDKKDKEERNLIIQSIRKQITNDKESIESSLTNIKSVNEQSKELIQYLKVENRPIDSIWDKSFGVFFDVYFTPSFLSISDLNNSYDLNKLNNYALIDQLKELFDIYELANYYNKNYSALLNNEYQEYWRNNYDLINKKAVPKKDQQVYIYRNIVNDLNSWNSRKFRHYSTSLQKTEDILKTLNEL